MADVRPFEALHYDLAKVGSLDAVAAPPYDVIDAAGRARLLRALALQRGRDRPAEAVRPRRPGERPRAATPTRGGADDRGLARRRRPGRRTSEPSIWALTQDYTAPDGSSHSRHGDPRPGAGRGLRERRCARTSAPTPARSRTGCELTRATGYNLSPIFSLSTEDAWPLVEPALAGRALGRGDRRERHRQPASGRSTDPAVHAAVSERLAGAELLIADGHHRYETARAYRDEVGGEGPHNYTLMALTGLDDPGLTVFPTHRLLSGFAADPERQRRLGAGLRELFEVERGRPSTQIDPAARRASASSASTTPSTSRPTGCG